MVTGLRHFLADNWFSLMTAFGLVAGAVWQLGFRERDFAALRDYAYETRATQVKRVAELEQVRADVERLKWELAERKTTMEDMKIDVRSTAKVVQELEKKVEVVIQLLKPRGVGVAP